MPLPNALASPQYQPHRATPVALKVAAALACAVVVLAGLWLVTNVLRPDHEPFEVAGFQWTTYETSIAFGFLWFCVALLLIALATRGRPDLRMPMRVTYFAISLGVTVWVGWTTFRPDQVENEQVATAAAPAKSDAGAGDRSRDRGRERSAPSGNVALAGGSFEPLAHAGAGTATVIELAEGGKVLTLTDFETDQGPDLRVYLQKGEPGGPEFEDLGALKGNKGNQQYELPSGVDPSKFDSVVVWCRAFSVGFSRAELKAP